MKAGSAGYSAKRTNFKTDLAGLPVNEEHVVEAETRKILGEILEADGFRATLDVLAELIRDKNQKLAEVVSDEDRKTIAANLSAQMY